MNVYNDICNSPLGIPNAIFSYLDHNDIDNLGLTCRWLEHEKQQFRSKANKIDLVLNRFLTVGEIGGFQDIQVRIGGFGRANHS